MAASSTPRGMGDGEGNTFDLVSSQLDRLHDLLRDESDEENKCTIPAENKLVWKLNSTEIKKDNKQNEITFSKETTKKIFEK